MTAILIVSLATLIALAKLWSVRRTPRAALMAALPASLLPLAAAMVYGAWQYYAVMDRVGRTGSGGLASVVGMSLDWMTSLLSGVAGGMAILVAALILQRRATTSTPTPGSPARWVSVAWAAVLVAVVVALPLLLARSERVALGLLDRLVPLAQLPATPDFGYSDLRALSNRDAAAQNERDWALASRGSMALAVACAVLLLMTRRRAALGSAATASLAALAIAGVGLGVWYATHLLSVRALLYTLTA